MRTTLAIAWPGLSLLRDAVVQLTNSDNGMPLASALAFQTLPGEHNAFRFSMVG